MELYKLEKVYKTYKSKFQENHALNGIDLNINEGEIVIILGPSGSGKSTMLNVLSGIDYITRGKIYFQNERLDKFDEENLLNYRKENLGFIFQSYNFISNLTVKENIDKFVVTAEMVENRKNAEVIPISKKDSSSEIPA